MAWSWYTKGRRIPTLIGKDVSGRRIPGGPYTGLQAVTAGAVPAALWWTRPLWAADMAGLAMFAVIIGATIGAVKLVGKVDFASCNPVLLLGGYLRQMGRPLNGTLAGRKLADPRPHRIAGRINLTHTSLNVLETVAASAAAQPTPASQPAPAAIRTEAAVPAESNPSTPAAAPMPPTTRAPSRTRQPDRGASSTAAPLQPDVPPAPDRRRTGLEAFLAAAAAARPQHTQEDAA